MAQQSVVSWLCKCAITALALLLACGVATALVGSRLQMPATTTRDGTLATLNRYVEALTPDIVLAGSSMTFRLREEYFASPSLRNVALSGGSPITGLEVVLSQPRVPRLILVETNVISRDADEALAARYAHGRSLEPRFIRPIRAAVAAYENWRHASPTHAQVVAEMDRLLKAPPSDFDSRLYLERMLASFDQDPATAAQANADRLLDLAGQARRRGARVLLFELPYPARLETTRWVEVTRNVVHARFPDPAQWLPIDVDTAQLRWLDGIHLDDRSAMLVSRSIERAVGLLAKPD
ncbi:hypothetical protein [Bradyrhizobium sp. NP1]|uniref:hypothetical protein n=1 Tax=Bradyrhizobium sp. NP1 TaxID=3049772 RepID=UPI0025A59847|nr:hypothetical protein [Bradyrhizobium sp. NP1]WJR76334.1 hypothetical protein QOU61_26715 [Bradyrhizobium sp. NP1]